MNDQNIAGCLIITFQALVILTLAWIGNIMVGYNLETWFGYIQWTDVNIFIRLFVGLAALSIAFPLAIVAFVLSLVFGVPILI